MNESEKFYKTKCKDVTLSVTYFTFFSIHTFIYTDKQYHIYTKVLGTCAVL